MRPPNDGKLGFRRKFFGKNWEDPWINDYVPKLPENIREQQKLYCRGFYVDRSYFPESLAIYDKNLFSKRGNIFFAAGFLAIKKCVVDAFSEFNIGNSEFYNFAIFEEDGKTVFDDSYYFINIGNRKDTFSSGYSKNVRKLGFNKNSGHEVWVTEAINDGDIAIRRTALEGPDLWVEDQLTLGLFMTDRLARALQSVSSVDLHMARCTLVD